MRGDGDRFHHHVGAQQVGDALLDLGVGTLDVRLGRAPQPRIVERREDRAGSRRLAELDGERHQPRLPVDVEQAHRGAQEASRRRRDAVEDGEIEQVEPPGVTQGGEVLPAGQQRGHGLRLDREIVGNDGTAAQLERVDAVEALPAEFLVAREARADRGQRQRRTGEQVVVALEAARAVELLPDDADAQRDRRRRRVPQHAMVLVGREFLVGRKCPRMGRQAVVGRELVEATRLLEQLRAQAAARALRLVLRQAGGAVDVGGGDGRRRLVAIGRRRTDVGHRLRRAEQPHAEQARPVRQGADDAQILERRRIVDRQRLDQLDAVGMVGDLEHAAKTVGIGFVDRVDVDRGERHPRMGGLVPGIEAAEDDHAIVTRLPVVQLDLEMVFRAASLQRWPPGPARARRALTHRQLGARQHRRLASPRPVHYDQVSAGAGEPCDEWAEPR